MEQGSENAEKLSGALAEVEKEHDEKFHLMVVTIRPREEVVFDEALIRQEEFVYYMLHKPAGILTATRDRHQRTVLDLLHAPAAGIRSCPARAGGEELRRASVSEAPGGFPEPALSVLRRGLFPVGRLDRDTEGLLLITDDGQLAHGLLAPGKHVDKTYYAVVTGQVTEEEVRMFEEGIRIDDAEGKERAFRALPARLRVLEDPFLQDASGRGDPGASILPVSASEEPSAPPLQSSEIAGQDGAPLQNFASGDLAALLPVNFREKISVEITECTQTLVTIREGKYHQIRRMFAAVGKEVLYLKRLTMGPLQLDPLLPPGAYRPLTREETDSLLLCARRLQTTS